MKNITFRIDDHLLTLAREKARKEHTSLNDLFKTWLEDWTGHDTYRVRYDNLMNELQLVCESGGPFSREDMNER